MNNNILETMLPTEMYYEILIKLNGYERENMRLVCKLFYLYNPIITTDNPERDLEVRLFTYPNSIYQLLDYGHENVVITYLKNHSDKIYRNVAPGPHIQSIFSQACKNGARRIISMLIEEIKYLNIPVYYAALGGYMDIINYIFEHKKDKPIAAKALNMGLYGACESNNMDIIKYMLAMGANDIDTAIMICCNRGHTDTVQYLTDYMNKH